MMRDFFLNFPRVNIRNAMIVNINVCTRQLASPWIFIFLKVRLLQNELNMRKCRHLNMQNLLVHKEVMESSEFSF